jgi:hypothetical protein
MSDDIFSLGHLWVARSNLTPAAIEARLREMESDRESIRGTLAFIMLMRAGTRKSPAHMKRIAVQSNASECLERRENSSSNESGSAQPSSG